MVSPLFVEHFAEETSIPGIILNEKQRSDGPADHLYFKFRMREKRGNSKLWPHACNFEGDLHSIPADGGVKCGLKLGMSN